MRQADRATAIYDLAVLGGGINGAGIACDAAERGYSVALLESHDFAAGTSSRSSKLIHGGLRYLEYYDFRLVRESLAEREVLMRKAPHLVWPIRFVMPVTPDGHPAWKIRAGLFLYDHLARRQVLPGTEHMDLRRDDGLQFREDLRRGYVYSDCRVDDARLVIANVLAAERAGAAIMARHRFDGAERLQGLWHIRATRMDTGEKLLLRARAIANAAGPWALTATRNIAGASLDVTANLVRGSHILLPRFQKSDHATMLQAGDGRVVVTMPFEDDFTLIGTTDSRFEGDPRQVSITGEERDYLLALVRRFFRIRPSAQDIVWTYSGVRPLFDEGRSRNSDPTRATRDYAFRLDGGESGSEPALLTVLGGKLTSYRKLAEHAVEELQRVLPAASDPAESVSTLPGGDIGDGSLHAFAERLCAERPGLPPKLLRRYARTYGSRAHAMLDNAARLDDLGLHFGGDLYEREVDFLIRTEWAASAEDILWRRTKCGLRVPPEGAVVLAEWLAGSRLAEVRK